MDETINGTAGTDTLYGGTGNDTINGEAGSDQLYGGTGNDLLDGGIDDDTIYGGDGNDVIVANFGVNEGYYGGAGNDTYQVAGSAVDGYSYDVNLETGQDQYGRVLSSIETVLGGSGIDTITGRNDTSELLDGGVSNDIISGNGGNDTLLGGFGADYVYGGLGDDAVDGGQGADLIYGGTGNDTLDGGTADGEADTIFGDGGNDVLFGGTGGSDLLYGGADRDTLNGGLGTDVLYGDTGDDVLYGDMQFGGVSGAGADTLYGGDGNDSLFANPNANTQGAFLYGGAGNDVISGSGQADYIDAGDGSDRLYGNAGNDTLLGGAGDDIIYVGAGNQAFGGAGDDVFRFDPSLTGNAAITIVGGETGEDLTDPTNGGAGDVLDLRGLTILTNTPSGAESGTVTYQNAAGETVSITYSEIENILRDPGIVDGTAGADRMTPTSGAGGTPFTDVQGDQIDGSDGLNDTISGGTGNDTIDAGLGNDTVFGGDNSDVIEGNVGNDVLSGDSGNDLIYGDVGSAALTGNRITNGDFSAGLTGWTIGNPTGGPGPMEYGDGRASFNNNDEAAYGDSIRQSFETNAGQQQTLTLDLLENGGGVGNHTFKIDILNAAGTVIATTTQTVNNGSVLPVSLNFTSTTTTNTLLITNTTATATVATDGQVDNVVIQPSGPLPENFFGNGDDTIDGGIGADTVFGGAGNDVINGGADNDLLYGGAGNDILQGGTGNDTLYGEDGDDNLLGDAGEAVIFGGAGNDNIQGDTSKDLLYGGDGNDWFNAGAGNDTIYGGAGNDRTTQANNGDDLIYGGAGNDTMSGGIGNDTIDGGTGNDVLTGGAGADLFLYTPGDGADTIADFNTGADFIDLSSYYDDIWELHADQADDGILNQSNTLTAAGKAVDYSNNTKFAPGGSLTFTGGVANGSFFNVTDTGVVCFAAGTLIETEVGEVAVETLQAGDLVSTLDNGLQPIRWIARRDLSSQELDSHENFRPIRIREGALGNGCPAHDLLVSPQHRMLVSSNIALRMFDSRQVLIAAKHLVGINGIEVAQDLVQVSYFHILFDRHEVIFANQTASESLYTGPQALKSLAQEAREEIFALFPDLAETHYVAQSCRPIAEGRVLRRLLLRHQNNNKRLTGYQAKQLQLA